MERYNYNDVTLYKRGIKGVYLNITDYEIDGDNQKIRIDEQSEYIIAIDNYESKDVISYICVTLDDIKDIIGISGINVRSTLGKALQNGKYADLVYAEMLLNTGRHKRILMEEGMVLFQMRKPPAEGTSKREWATCGAFSLITKPVKL